MRKKVFGKQLSRTKNQRKALFRSLVRALLIEGEITTTLIKAKAVRGQTEKLITRAKGGSLADRRLLHRFLTKRELVNRLVDEIAPRFKDRDGGYLRIVRTGRRRGDATQEAKLMFTEEVGKLEPRKQKKEVARKEVVKETGGVEAKAAAKKVEAEAKEKKGLPKKAASKAALEAEKKEPKEKRK